MLIIGIAGGSGSGKTTVVKKIVANLPSKSVSILSQDSYYKDHGHLSEAERLNINFDHPDAIEWKLLTKHLTMLSQGEKIEMPVYDYKSCSRLQQTISVNPTRVIIVEGILILTHAPLRAAMNIKVFVDAEADVRLTRIMKRDIAERGRSFEDVLKHYEKFVKPMHHQFIEPIKRYADIIVPQGGKNTVAIEILTSRIKLNLNM